MRRIGKMLEYPVSKVHVLDYAEPNYRKAFPLVTLNVLVSALIGFLFTTAYLLLKSSR